MSPRRNATVDDGTTDDRPPDDGTPASSTKGSDPTEISGVDPGIAALSYEQARDELIDVVHRLEEGGATLEESLALWERGEALARRCQTWLDGARRRLDDARAAVGETDLPEHTNNPSRAHR